MKKKRFCSALMILCLAAVCPLQAQNPMIPYHEFTEFLLEPAGIGYPGLLGYSNPAAAALHGPQALFFFSGGPSGILGENRGSTGLFAGTAGLSAGYIRRTGRFAGKDGGTRQARLTDYRIAAAAGSGRITFGIGYSSVRAEAPARGSRPRESILGGLVFRPGPYMSAGFSGLFARRSDDFEAVFDLGIRPFGDSRLTLFTDAAWYEDRLSGDVRWSAGLSSEILPGIQLSGRYFSDSRFSAGLSLSLGRLSLTSGGRSKADQGGSASYVYGIRYGAPLPNLKDCKTSRGSRYLQLDLSGELQLSRYRFFDRGGPSLASLLRTIQSAAADPRVAVLALNLSGFSVSAELAWEIREELAAFQKTGRKVLIYLDAGGMNSYHLASCADFLLIDPQASLLLPGYAMSRTYLTDLMETIGLGFDEWRFFRYKSAYEQYSRSSMSQADKEQRSALLDAFYDTFINDVCRSRGLEDTYLDSLIQTKAAFTAREAVEAGLADRSGRWHKIDSIIAGLEGRKMQNLSSADLTPVMFPRRQWGARPVIALVYAEGVCAMDEGIRARTLEKTIRRLTSDSQVKAVVLRVNSPGGDGLASDLVAEALRECRDTKPVIISQGAVAASGGYWLSMYGDSIFAAPNTVTGSIGVIGGWVWDKSFSRKLGISTDGVKRGIHADLLTGITLPMVSLPLPPRNLAPDERDIMERGIRSMYNDFLSKAAAGRDMPVADMRTIAQGRVWSGYDAAKIGLTDGLGGLSRAVAAARSMAGIAPGREVKLIELPQKGLIDLSLFVPEMPLLRAVSPAFSGPLVYPKMLAEFNGRPLFMLPYSYLPLTTARK